MRRNIHPKQISLFDSVEDGGITERERERERVSGAPGHLFHDIISFKNLLAAWREFLRGKRKRKDVAEFSLNLTSNIIKLHRELADKAYRHGPYKAFRINDPKPRDIHKATVRDRLLHHAIYRILYLRLDPKFIFDSYSCRYDKGIHRAINRFRAYARKVSKNHTQTAWVLKCDIRKFFASIDHEILINILKLSVKNEHVIWLLREVVGSFHTEGKPAVGLPLGNLTSQLLANVYMNEFDHFLKRELKVAYCIRYADDFVILHEDKKYLENILPKISAFLEASLKLSLHPDKVFIKTLTSGVDFLGWAHFAQHRVLRTSTKRRMFKKLAATDNPKSKTSYLGLLSHGNTYRLQQRIRRLE
jgi:retron-type reverse transcriptase